MNFKILSKGRIAAGIVTAAVVAGSVGVMAFAANRADMVHKNVLMAEANTQNDASSSNLAQALINSQGTIEYTKTTHTITEDDKFSDEKNFIAETWLDPVTYENRQDCKVISADNKVEDFHSTYLKNDCNDAVTIQRDLQGNAVSGTITKMPELSVEKNGFAIKQRAFASVKERSSLPEWKDEGAEKTADGKELKKLSQTYMNSNPDNVQVKTRLVYYVDTATGFPVREELYQDVNGSMKLIWYDVYEYKYVDDDGGVFDTSGVELKETSIQK